MRLINFFIILFIWNLSSATARTNFSSSTTNSTFSEGPRKLLRQARKSYTRGKYEDAISKYEHLVKLDSSNFQYNYEAGLAFYSKDNLKTQCIPYFERAARLSSDHEIGDVHFYLGRAYHLNGQYQQSINSYNQYLKMIESNGTFLSEKVEQELIAQVKRQIEMCNNAIEFEKNPKHQIFINGKLSPFAFEPLGKEINSEYDDYSQLLSQNDSVLYFASRRPIAKGKKDWDEKYYEAIYSAKKSNSGWNAAEALSSEINSKKHNAPNFISLDGKQVYIYRSDKKGSIFVSDIDQQGNWSEPKLLEIVKDVNSKGRETSVTYALFGNILYLVSNRSGGFGGRDIYFTEKDKNGNWSELKNLGPEINSPYDEDAPFVSADGTTLYFSSNGHNSMGGYDVFYSVLENGKWSKPENMGTPFNSPADDIYFVPDKKGETIYLSSSRVQNRFSDFNIYGYSTTCKNSDSTTIKGLLADKSFKLLISDPTDMRTNAMVDVDENGNYELKLIPEKTYRLTFVKENFPRFTSDFEVPTQCEKENYYQFIDTSSSQKTNQTDYEFLIRNAFFVSATDNMSMTDRKSTLDTLNEQTEGYSKSLVELSIPKTSVSTVTTVTGATYIQFANILFDFDRSNVKDEFYAELEKLKTYLLENPDKKIKIAGHTDALGDAGYNRQLSARRANAVKKYLQSKGIKTNRIELTYFGEDQPSKDNETDEGRKFNRRVEITVF